jgi:hypothetical protein
VKWLKRLAKKQKPDILDVSPTSGLRNYRMSDVRSELCDVHQRMVDHDEEINIRLTKIETGLGGIYWLAAAMFVAALGSIGALVSVSYQSGALMQSVNNNSAQIERVLKLAEQHPIRRE